MTIPQIWLVYSLRDARTISLFMWSAYNVASIILLAYGLKHKIPVVIWAQILWLAVQTPMIIAALVF